MRRASGLVIDGESAYLDQVEPQPLQPVDDSVQGSLIEHRSADDGLHRFERHPDPFDLGKDGIRNHAGHPDLILERGHKASIYGDRLPAVVNGLGLLRVSAGNVITVPGSSSVRVTPKG
jgi:hypothetical protein